MNDQQLVEHNQQRAAQGLPPVSNQLEVTEVAEVV